MTKIIVSVISDLVTDQRVHKVSQTLHDMGFDVLLVGTKKQIVYRLNHDIILPKGLQFFFKKDFYFMQSGIFVYSFICFLKKHHCCLPMIWTHCRLTILPQS